MSKETLIFNFSNNQTVEKTLKTVYQNINLINITLSLLATKNEIEIILKTTKKEHGHPDAIVLPKLTTNAIRVDRFFSECAVDNINDIAWVIYPETYTFELHYIREA